MEIVFLFTGLIAGALIAWLIVRNKATSQVAALEQKSLMLQAENEAQKTEIGDKTQEIISLNTALSAKDKEVENFGQKLKDQKEELAKLREQFNLEFKNLANEILEEKTKKFTEQNRTNLDEILKPLNEKIKDFEKKVTETYDKEAQQRFSLKEEVKRLAELNQQISKEASSLTKALKGESKTQGNWGEVILEGILERTGLQKGQEYLVQESFTNEDGKRFQPDVIVHYPGERSIVVDSKVSLTAYERFAAAEDDEGKAVELKAHLTSIKNHINELSGKKYEDLVGTKTLDFVVMFLPIEPAYLLAVQNDPTLWSYAYEKRILLVSPTNLVAILKMIESLWKQEYQSRNVIEIARQGGDLYDKFVGLVDDLLEVGRKLKATQKSYEDSMNKLSTGKGNLVRRVENLKSLGVKVKKQMPDKLVERALEEGDGD